ncbi:MAG: hypothetical protein FVQ85_03555 [Planctomycetes bacterium]|nr:hypothetical protein [Planctomycetota bacterium]
MNVSNFITKDYEDKTNWTLGENEPKTNPIKANTNPIYRGVASGKAGSKPISSVKIHRFQAKNLKSSVESLFWKKL